MKRLLNNYKNSYPKINILYSNIAYIQSDGEIIGTRDFSVKLLPAALNFII
ncbi:hypothetical protein [Lutibacter sp. B1]|uniref:hypothetical protein n=1 Tax=Lutibacter sp. B1 TaxID=2725996 RepID=UPI00145738D6|nr:hypothetical protein [Lutibacter sp. B1]NLP59087.1 hypothetical protein [Lutibacter sp. B1]